MWEYFRNFPGLLSFHIILCFIYLYTEGYNTSKVPQKPGASLCQTSEKYFSDHLTLYSVLSSIHIFSFRFFSPRSLFFPAVSWLAFPIFPIIPPKVSCLPPKEVSLQPPHKLPVCLNEENKWQCWNDLGLQDITGGSQQVFPYCALVQLLKAALIPLLFVFQPSHTKTGS